MTPETVKLIAKSLNTAMVILIGYGLLQRRRPSVHIPVMLTAFAVDLVNVLIVEIVARQTKGEGAVEQASKAMIGEGTFLQQFHVAVSALCIVCYVVAVFTGMRLHKKGIGRKGHKANAAIFLVSRLASYVTSFWM